MHRIVPMILSLIICATLTSVATAQERMRIAWAGSTPSNTPIWVADQKGFFKKKWSQRRGHQHQRQHDRHSSAAHRRSRFHRRSVGDVGHF